MLLAKHRFRAATVRERISPQAAAASLHPRGIGFGVACDLMITVPALYYLLLVGRGYSAWAVLPAAVRSALPTLRWLALPLGLWILFRVARRWRVRQNPAVLYYALLSWRARPASEPDSRSFPLAEASGYGMFSILMMIALVVEGIPAHLLLLRWSHTAAWIFTALGIYGCIWMLALRRALALHPALIGNQTVRLQIGFLRSVEFRRDQILAVRRFSPNDPPPDASLVVWNEPQWLIALREPVAVRGLFGRRKMAARIAVAVDDGEGFAAALTVSPDD